MIPLPFTERVTPSTNARKRLTVACGFSLDNVTTKNYSSSFLK